MRISDWSSDVCSSDLAGFRGEILGRGAGAAVTVLNTRLCRLGGQARVFGGFLRKFTRFGTRFAGGFTERLHDYLPPEFRFHPRPPLRRGYENDRRPRPPNPESCASVWAHAP